jgi:hypothetical protein
MSAFSISCEMTRNNFLAGRPSALTNWRIDNNIFYQCGILNGGKLTNFDKGTNVIIDYNVINAGGEGGTVLDIDGSTYDQPDNLAGTPGLSVTRIGARATINICRTTRPAEVRASTFLPPCPRWTLMESSVRLAPSEISGPISMQVRRAQIALLPIRSRICALEAQRPEEESHGLFLRFAGAVSIIR